MATRSSPGEGGLRWDEKRQRRIGRVSPGYFPNGKRRIGTVSAKTKTEAKLKLRNLLRERVGPQLACCRGLHARPTA